MDRSRSSFPNVRSEWESSLVGKIGKHGPYCMQIDTGVEKVYGV